MGTCEEGNPPLEIETQNEISLGTASDDTHHDVVVVEGDVDDQDQNQNRPAMEETAIVEQLENLELESNGDAANVVKEEEAEEGAEEEEEEGKSHNYPLRPNAADCAFYVKTGFCKYGLYCRFNHPSKRVFRPVGEKQKGTEEFNEVIPDTGKIECKYFSTPGGCKYGDACRYDHPSEKIEMKDPELNFLGLPLRPMEKECMFYMRTGTCAYGASCRFHHPDPAVANESEPGNSPASGYLQGDSQFSKTNEPMYSSGALKGTLSNGTNSKNSLQYSSNMSSYRQGMPQNPGWNQTQGTVSLSANKPTLPHQIVNSSKKTDPLTHYERLMHIEEFPERPGQPDCDYFMKTGDCKYRSACRFNHPIIQASRLRLPALSSKGLNSRTAKVSPAETIEPHNSISANTSTNGRHSDNHQKMQNGEFPERPGQPECEYFMKTGNCKYKSACRYHHPRNRMPTPSPCSLNEKGLPLRPGTKVCRNYEREGTCQYGHRCLFHHPGDILPAAPVVAEDHDHSSTNIASATNVEPQTSNNVVSDWGDGWVM